MTTTTTYPNGSVITEYETYINKTCTCSGSCNCISQRYPKFNQKHYIPSNQQAQVCVDQPTYQGHSHNVHTQAVYQHDDTFYRTEKTSTSNLKETVYNILPAQKDKEADNYNPFVLNPFAINSYLQQGYPANLYQVPKNKEWALVQGDGIRFEEYETGLKLHTTGVKSITVNGIIGSGIITQNTGTLQEPKFTIGVNSKEFASTNNLVQEVTFNGKSYTPIDGKIFINSGTSGTPINKITSNNNSVVITPTAVGEYNIQTASINVKGVSTKTNITDRKQLDFIDGVNTEVKLTNDNQVSVNVTGVVRSINSQLPDTNGNIIFSTATQPIFYQFRKTLTLSDITVLQTTGIDLTTVTVNQGTKPSTIVNTDGLMPYLNGDFLPLDKYTRSGNIFTISNTVSISNNDSLSIVIIKSA